MQICSRCVMDSTDPDIRFDETGVCNHCLDGEVQLQKIKFTPAQEKENLERLADKIKKQAKGKSYDSIIGLSGGVDSSYVAYLAHQMGLNPLAVHFDNGWNSEIAVDNIKKIVDKCGFDLITYVIDWPEFKDLQRSFFKAGVVDVEMLTDHAIMATMFKIRREHKIDFVLSGTNYATEHGFPKAWSWAKQDLTNIKAIQKKFGSRKLKAFPSLTSFELFLIKQFGLGGQYVEPLNQIAYNKNQAIRTLEKEFEWRYYGGKHYESVFTKFYQAYYLPEKFNYDKRKPHLSCQIRNGEITRQEALEELARPSYDPNELKIEKKYVLKKLGFSEQEFETIMKQAPKSHLDYPSDRKVIQKLRPIQRALNLAGN
jgi:N-acetyl sugar amidotransferase